jgi:hypothetical protein
MQPSPEHQRIVESAGKWNVDCTFYMSPDSPTKAQGTETVTLLGNFWAQTKFAVDMMGMPFEGRCQFGFDAMKGRYISTWIDSMSPFIFIMEGQVEDDGVLRMSGPGPDWQGGMAEYRTEEVLHAPDHRTFSMFMKGPQGEMKTMELEYRRA